MGPPRFPEGLYDLDEKDYTMATTTVAGVPLAFISYNEFDPEGGAASAARAISAIKDARAASSTPVIFAHWGDEYAPAAPRVKKLARQFVDAGAALVVGSHPHVVEERETYKDALIYYSLGNFIFDQYWSDDVRNGLLLKVIFSGGKAVSVTEIPIVLQKDGRTCLSTLPSGAAEKP
jgi:poly-gamma-glutamate synthesis protein (capsule biosynthesis protein)